MPDMGPSPSDSGIAAVYRPSIRPCAALPEHIKNQESTDQMTWHNKVIWTEGMFLQPQHFQQQDRFAARQLDGRIAAGLQWPWGLVSLQIDDAALLQGRVVLSAARGVLPDGTAFAVPDDDAAPPAFEVPPDARDQLLVLAVATVVGLPLPLLPLQILWLNLVTDTFPALALAVEPAESDEL